jgi:hypothetical protein
LLREALETVQAIGRCFGLPASFVDRQLHWELAWIKAWCSTEKYAMDHVLTEDLASNPGVN